MARILLIDDDPDARELVGAILEGEHEVCCVGAWRDAEPFLFGPAPCDLILVDVTLSGVSGVEVARSIITWARRAELERPPRVVLFSGLDESALAASAKEIGAAGYLQKTLSGAALRAAVRRFLGHRSDASASRPATQ